MICYLYLISTFFLFFLPGYHLFAIEFNPKKITVIGAGYVGLVSSGGLATIGHSITCVDIDSKKIEALNNGSIPIYEPNLYEMIMHNVHRKRLTFSSQIDKAIEKADIIIVTVGTPMDDSGNADLTALKKAVATIASHLSKTEEMTSIASHQADYKIICIKSTVPPGTNEEIKKIVKDFCGHENFDIVSNPEFLREGSAIDDFFEKNPIVLGSDSEKALTHLETIYQPLIDKGRVLIKTNFATAELIKYAWNAFSAIKITYVNELSFLCNKTHADIAQLVFGMSFSDELLPMRNIIPGPGIGGSCLPKDTRAFSASAEKIGSSLEILKASIEADTHHRDKIFAHLCRLINNNLEGKTIGILGLSFKANTDDIRCSPALDIIEKLLLNKASVKAYDPKAMEQMKNVFPNIMYCDTAYDAIKETDALILLTDWNEFKLLDFELVAKLMKKRLVMDTRNMWSPLILEKNGFNFINLGRFQ